MMLPLDDVYCAFMTSTGCQKILNYINSTGHTSSATNTNILQIRYYGLSHCKLALYFLKLLNELF